MCTGGYVNVLLTTLKNFDSLGNKYSISSLSLCLHTFSRPSRTSQGRQQHGLMVSARPPCCCCDPALQRKPNCNLQWIKSVCSCQCDYADESSPVLQPNTQRENKVTVSESKQCFIKCMNLYQMDLMKRVVLVCTFP